MIRRKVRRPNHRSRPLPRVRHSRLSSCKHRLLHVFVTDRGSQVESSQVKSGDLVKATNYCTAQLHRTVVFGKLTTAVTTRASCSPPLLGSPEGETAPSIWTARSRIPKATARPLGWRRRRRRRRRGWLRRGLESGALGSRNPAACRLHERVRRAASRPGPSRTG